MGTVGGLLGASALGSERDRVGGPGEFIRPQAFKSHRSRIFSPELEFHESFLLNDRTEESSHRLAALADECRVTR